MSKFSTDTDTTQSVQKIGEELAAATISTSTSSAEDADIPSSAAIATATASASISKPKTKSSGWKWPKKKEKVKKELKIILIGIDGAGKTTLLYQQIFGEVVTTIPTIGFNVESLKIEDYDCTIWDIGGQPNIRALWGQYLENTGLIIFVIKYICFGDNRQPDRIQESKRELHQLLKNSSLDSSTPILILINTTPDSMLSEGVPSKADKEEEDKVSSPMTLEEISVLLDLENLNPGTSGGDRRPRPYKIQICSAITGDRVKEGISWGLDVAPSHLGGRCVQMDKTD
jgi:small GTP-binding protein